MGRPLSTAPESVDSATAYIVGKWTEPVVRLVDAVWRVHGSALQLGSRLVEVNERFDNIRQLQLLLRGRTFASAMRQVRSLSASILDDSDVFPPDRIGPLQEIIQAASEFSASLDALRTRVDGVAGSVAVYGPEDRFNAVADAAREYGRRPSNSARKALARVLRIPTLEDRTELIRASWKAAPRTRTATAGEWAHYAIHLEMQVPCNSSVLNTKRREEWREVLRQARTEFRGSRKRAK